MRDLHAEVGTDVARVAPQDDNAVGQQHRLFDVVRYQENGLGGHGLLGPQFQQFAAQVLGGQNVKSGKGFVHEKDFGLDDQGASKAHPLAHAAGKLLGIGGLESIQTYGIEHAQAALAALVGRNAAGLQGRLDVFEDGEPGEQGEALKHDGDIDLGFGDRFPVPVHVACRGTRKPRQHAQHGRLSGTGRAQQRQDLSRHDLQVGRRDDLNAIFARLCIVFFDLFGLYDGFAGHGLNHVLNCSFWHA